MKVLLVVSVLTIVGACAHKRHSEKLADLKDGIRFEQENHISEFASTIKASDLKSIVYELSSNDNEGRKTGTYGHNRASKFIKDYYIKKQIASPLGGENYYQSIPKSFLSKDFNSSQNVIAYIKGSEFPEEVLIISAHSDHLGMENNIVNPGADDNASGTAAIMEIAEAFKTAQLNGFTPKRSIVFLHLTGEEEGLYGSRYYIEHPVFSLNNTVANLNIDMIGRIDDRHKDNPNYIYLIGSDRISTELHYISEEANAEFTQLDLDYRYNAENDPNRYYYRSDHYNFAQMGIPVIFYFNGEHEDYHQPSDTADKLNYDLLEKRTKLIFATAWYVANNTQRLVPETL
ncbi:M28 family metallopeptidase [Subsaxibacter sp. CAU 1640]|uniref:M28 family metallopeptidase n=1 Tax=Subsaxibacter sp. CAU 1640 TaxID=2933271 RepID=UPI00200545D5|nr:M28 family metallopeptidase [Subsaxibacter sp. CAU 1640]MCK7590784.1 M28 family metallopeptidase [Subsaxibacter sp. CAU 1640]